MTDYSNVQEKVREQFRAAETAAEQTFHAWNDVAKATTTLAFDSAAQNMRYAQEARGQADRATNEAFETYRRMVQDGLATWTGYVQSVSSIFSRNT